MTGFWTGLLMGTVLGSFLSVTILLFYMGTREQMTAEEWKSMRDYYYFGYPKGMG